MRSSKELEGINPKYLQLLMILSIIVILSCEKNKSAISEPNQNNETQHLSKDEEIYLRFYDENNNAVNELYKDSLYVAIIGTVNYFVFLQQDS